MANLKTRPKTNEELLAEMNRSLESWKQGRAIPLSEAFKILDEAIITARKMEKQFSEQEQEGDDN